MATLTKAKAVTIKDEQGNEHPLTKGDLVQYKNTAEGVWVFRIMGIYSESEATCIDPANLSRREYYLNPKCFTFISSEPPYTKSEGIPLVDRRVNFINNLLSTLRANSASKTLNSYKILNQIYMAMDRGVISERTWFWNGVAESMEDPKQVSYPAEMSHYDDDKRRKRCSFSKFLKGAAKKVGGLDDKWTDTDCDLAAKMVGDHFPDSYDYTFEVVSGDAAKDLYYEEGEGNAGSCMYKKRQTAWYGENPEGVGMLRIVQGKVFKGRALLWNTQQGVKVLDRIYPSNNGPHITAAINHCKEQGWDYKTKQVSASEYFASGRLDYTVRMKPSTVGYPYLDTFKYTDNDPKTDEEIILQLKPADFHLTSTEGGYTGERRVCNKCKGRCSGGYNRTAKGYYCNACFDQDFIRLEYRLPASSGGWREGIWDRKDVIECPSCKENRHKNDTCSYESAKGEPTPCCKVCVSKSAKQCADCGGYKSRTKVDKVGDFWYCNECDAKKFARCSECGLKRTKNRILCEVNYDGSEGLSFCQVCAVAKIANGFEREFLPLGEDREKFYAAPEKDPSYPEASWPYDHFCQCDTCKAIKRRRTEEAKLSIGMDCGNPNCCVEVRRKIKAYIEAPYPNQQEVVVLIPTKTTTNINPGRVTFDPAMQAWVAMNYTIDTNATTDYLISPLMAERNLNDTEE